jgi:GNAT superfamily N-acetyltransferase
MTVAELEQRMGGWLSTGEYTAVLFINDADDGGDIAGYALFRREPDHVYLRQFFVRADRRRAGIGRAALTWLRQNAWVGVPRVRLDVLVGNEPAIAFWRSAGFHEYCVTMEAE